LGKYRTIKIDLPFFLSTMDASLAREALLDQDFILNLRQQVKAEKRRLIKGLGKGGQRDQ